MVQIAREVEIELKPDLRIRFGRGAPPPPTFYAITLEFREDGAWTTVRLWDNADGVDEHHEHAYTRAGGKQPPVVHEFASPNEGMPAAIDKAELRGEEIVRQWVSS
jgi:hypothetical protein